MKDPRRGARRGASAAARGVMSLVAIGLALSCRGIPRMTEWTDEGTHRWRPLDVRRASVEHTRARSGFSDLRPSRTGITHRNDVADEHALANRHLLIGAGVAIGDVDGDGYPDIFLSAVEGPATLYRNLGNFEFEDVTATSGIVTQGLATTGAVFADVDGDGDLDLLVGTLGGPLMLWRNDGTGRFTDATAESGLGGGHAVTTMTLADVDGDGDLDLYVATYKVRNALDAYPPQARTFDQVVTRTANGFAVRPEWAHEYRIEDRPDLGGIVRSQRADPDHFYLNDGTGRFVRTPIRGPRFRDAAGRPLAAEPDYFTLAARFYDVNGDGAPDLYVCNDFEDPDQFWINDGAGNFRLVAPRALSATSNTCMSVDFGDVDRDGRVDLFTADMLSPTLGERQTRIPTHTPLPKGVGAPSEPGQWMRNMLHRARGDTSWAEIAAFARVEATDWTWGAAFMDVDLDGQEDLLVVNGHRWDIRDADTFDRIRDAFPRVPWDREQGEFPRLAIPDIALRNNGDLTFTRAERAWGFGRDSTISHGIALADLDGDGDLDVVITRLNAPPAVLRNESTAPRVAVRLAGPTRNRGGIGAVVTVRTTSVPAQRREMTSGGLYLSGGEEQLAFATGSDTTFVLEVDWPDGRRSTVADARPNRLYDVRHDGAVPAGAPSPPRARPAPLVGPADAAPSPLFEDATALLGGHVHHDALFDDFRRQPLLPQRFSQFGPGLAWADLDGDGWEDLVVGSGADGALTVLRNVQGRFRAQPAPTRARWDLTTLLPAPDLRGGLRLIAGQSNYEASEPAEALDVAAVLAFDGRGGAPGTARPLVPGDTASIGALAMADVDGDGILDLFVGARVVPSAWPMAAPSRLWLGTADGGFVADTLNASTLARLGLVTSALLVDLDADGRPDLVVASEFGPVRVLMNADGRLVDRTEALGLSGMRSRWHGLAAGDFDGDGRLDLVVTSWGRNVGWRATPERPLVLHAGVPGAEGIGLVFSRRDAATGREMPLESFARLGTAFPALRRRVATYGEFSRMSTRELFGTGLDAAVRVGATTFDHLVLWNRGDRFEALPLPLDAQLAPSLGVAVADFDGDGHEDLFLAQNFHPTEIGTMRFDAGVGLVLLGDGAGGFRALDVAASGVAIGGDQRGVAVADFDRDGRPDVAVGANGGPTALLRNRAGRPGIRVRVDGGLRNPYGVGAQLWIESAAGRGPVRAIKAGSGHWSSDGGIQVLAAPMAPVTVVVRWPGGGETRTPLEAGIRELVVRR